MKASLRAAAILFSAICILLLGALPASAESQAAKSRKASASPAKKLTPDEQKAGEEANAAEEAAVESEQPNYAVDQKKYSVARSSRGQLGLELLGTGLLYSFQGSYLLLDQVAINAGLAYFSVSAGSSSASATLIPVSASYLMGGPDHHFEALAGGTFIFASAEVTGGGITDRATGSTVFPHAGIGYRYWPAAGGFHFRATLYGMLLAKQIALWPGFSFGYAF